MDTLTPSVADWWVGFYPGPDGDGLTDEHFYEVVRLALALPGRWFVERCEDEFGRVSVLLVQDIEDADVLTFALSRPAQEIHLDLRLGGRIEPLGTFATVRRAMDHVLHVACGGAHDAGAGPHRATPAVAARLVGTEAL